MKTVIEMAREVWSAGEFYIGPSEKSLTQFAELVRADECEACAKESELWDCHLAAAAIRSRGNA